MSARRAARRRREREGGAGPEAAPGEGRGRDESSRPAGPPPRSALAEWAKTLAIAFVLFLILRTFLFQTFVITSGSMEDTLLVGDFLGISKAAYGPKLPLTDWHLPGYTRVRRGDIVVFRPPHDPTIDVVKRVVGLPGDTLEMREKVLYRNGEPQDEPYVRHSDPEGDVRDEWMDWQLPVILPGTRPEGFRPTRDDWGPLVVPEGHLFVMGDNRDDSIDSRYWGFLDRDRLKGEVLFIYFSYDSEALAPFPIVTEARWGRIGHRVR